MQNGSSVGMYTHCIHVFARFGADLPAQSVLSNEISASELSRKLIKSALLVGLPLSQSISTFLIRLCPKSAPQREGERERGSADMKNLKPDGDEKV